MLFIVVKSQGAVLRHREMMHSLTGNVKTHAMPMLDCVTASFGNI